jgi:hypothetical protein
LQATKITAIHVRLTVLPVRLMQQIGVSVVVICSDDAAIAGTGSVDNETGLLDAQTVSGNDIVAAIISVLKCRVAEYRGRGRQRSVAGASNALIAQMQ